MNADTFFQFFDLLAEAPNSVAKLRELILQLAVQGKLGTQDSKDEPALVLLERALNWQQRGVAEKRIRLPKKEMSAILKSDAPFQLPTRWEWTRLGQIIYIHSGDGLTSKDMREGNIPVFGGNGVNGHHDSANVHIPTLVIGRVGYYCGSIHITPQKAWITDNAFVTEFCDDAFDLAFLALLLRTTNLKENDNATAQPVISGSKIYPIVVGIPPLAEQRRIVAKVDELLGLCDELETRQGARRELRERLVQAALDQLLASRGPADFATNWHRFQTHFDILFDTPQAVKRLRYTVVQIGIQGKLVPQDPNDEPANSLVRQIGERKFELIRQGQIPKQSVLPAVPSDNLPFPIPAGWDWIRLETVCEIITKGSSPTWQGIQYVNAENGVLFVTSENVGNYVLRKMDDPKYVERRFNEMEPRSILKSGDLLVNLVGGSIGRSAIFDRDDIANINQAVGIICLVRGTDSIDRWYLLHYLNSPTSLQIMVAEQVETARANLSLTNMKHFLVPLPPQQNNVASFRR